MKIKLFVPIPVGLEEMMEARERRAARAQEMSRRLGCPVVSLTMNVAGPVKRTGLIDLVSSWGVERLVQRLGAPIEMELLCPPTGPEARLAWRGDARAIKAAAMAVEDEAPVGRLLDVDVLGEGGEKLSRPAPRACVVCGGPAFACARSRAHGLDAVASAMASLSRGWAALWLGDRAAGALLREARLSPKPGLVDGRNSGAHDDMGLATLEASAEALRPWLARFVAAGAERPGELAPLREVGIEAEAAMLEATGGANAHRGAIWSFGLLLGALGASLEDGEDPFARVGRLARGAGERELDTHGGAAFRRYGAGGARAEAERGLPSARRACRALRTDGPLGALLSLMGELEDTNLLHRGGEEGLRFVQERAREISCLAPELRTEAMIQLDEEMIHRRLSPGGAADMLALALFIDDVGLDP